MLSRALSAYVIGVDAHLIEVEVDITSKGLPHFSLVGLPDAAVKESKDRIKAALKNIGFNFPLKQITVNLAPADLKKELSVSSPTLSYHLALMTVDGILEKVLTEKGTLYRLKDLGMFKGLILEYKESFADKLIQDFADLWSE